MNLFEFWREHIPYLQTLLWSIFQMTQKAIGFELEIKKEFCCGSRLWGKQFCYLCPTIQQTLWL